MAVARPDLRGLGRIGKALSDPTRCQILLCLLDGAHYPTELAEHLQLTKANVSNHLACLRGCGLVVGTQEGRRVRYELADPRLAHALDDLAGLAMSVTATVCDAEEGVAS
jgi:ArsR family transcriptional regulator, cadmium/lead-responsive transcriptional repressor